MVAFLRQHITTASSISHIMSEITFYDSSIQELNGITTGNNFEYLTFFFISECDGKNFMCHVSDIVSLLVNQV